MALPHAESGQVVSIRPLAGAIRQARTTALLKAEQLEVMRLVLLEGKSLPEHQVAGEITVHCIEGQVEFVTPSATRLLDAGDWLHLERGEPHSLRAISDASLLLTICLLPGGGG